MKALIIGTVTAALAGSMAGSITGDAMHSTLALGGGPMAPVAAGTSPFGPDEPAGIWHGVGPAPDYVTGTGWAQSGTQAFEIPTHVEPDFGPDPPSPEPTRLDVKPYEDTPPPPTALPSEGGDTLAGAKSYLVPEADPPPKPGA